LENTNWKRTAGILIILAAFGGVGVLLWWRFTQLLDDPLRSRMAGHVEVQDLPTSVRDDEKAVEQLEGHRRHREEVEGHEHFAVILEEGQPPFARVASALDPPKIPSYGPFRDDEAEFLKFAVNAGRAPRILFRHLADQPLNLLGDLRPAAPWPGTPTPVQPKTRAAPADDGLGLDDDQDAGPTGPAAAESGPEAPVQGVQGRPRPFASEPCYLLPEGKDFQRRIGSTAEEDADYGEDGEDESRHEGTLVTWRNVALAGWGPRTASS
jgi:hypothetical protein